MFTESLQNRYSKSNDKIGNRSGREFSQNKQMEISGALYKEIYSQALQGSREQALEQLKQSKPNATELSVMSDGTIVYFDQTGTLFSLTTAEEKIEGKRVQYPVTEPVISRP
jgi:hypothetical protein